jgi:hypothetical protein
VNLPFLGLSDILNNSTISMEKLLKTGRLFYALALTYANTGYEITSVFSARTFSGIAFLIAGNRYKEKHV